jgi:hypothetical protein
MLSSFRERTTLNNGDVDVAICFGCWYWNEFFRPLDADAEEVYRLTCKDESRTSSNNESSESNH